MVDNTIARKIISLLDPEKCYRPGIWYDYSIRFRYPTGDVEEIPDIHFVDLKEVEAKTSRENDPTNPNYYKDGGIEAIDYIEAKGLGRGFSAGNVIKYVSRYQKKNGLEDLNKALWYLKRLIALETEGSPDEDLPPQRSRNVRTDIEKFLDEAGDIGKGSFQPYEFSITTEEVRFRLECNSLRVAAWNETEARYVLENLYDIKAADLKLTTKEG